jgi:hypothetical protein
MSVKWLVMLGDQCSVHGKDRNFSLYWYVRGIEDHPASYGNKVAGTYSCPVTSVKCRGLECGELCLNSPLQVFMSRCLGVLTALHFSEFVWETKIHRERAVFWDVTPCGLVDIDRRFRRVYCLPKILRRNTSQDWKSVGTELNREPLECGVIVLTTTPCLCMKCFHC